MMAGDWIKMRTDLIDDPAVLRISIALGQDEFAVIGRLHKLWSWADRHTADGVTAGVDFKWVDRFVSQAGFATELESVGWLKFSDGVLSFPGFEIHNGASAKSRCDAVIRQRQSRERHKGVTNSGDERVAIPRAFVRAVMQRDNYECVYCGTKSSAEREAQRKPYLSVDHIIPFSRHGRQAIEDLATCCKLCNNEKNDRTPQEWGILPEFLQPGLVFVNNTIVTQICDSDVSKDVTREEKRREELDNTNKGARAAEFQNADVTKIFNPKVSVITLPDGRKLDYDDDPMVWQAEFTRQWNELPHATKHPSSALNSDNSRLLFRHLQDPDWDWQAAFKLFPVWRPREAPASMSWFLTDGIVTKILEGECKFRSQAKGSQHGQSTRPKRQAQDNTGSLVNPASSNGANPLDW